jgi:hypothetical protein
VINFGAVAMSKEAALNLLNRLEEILGNSKPFADRKERKRKEKEKGQIGLALFSRTVVKG